jgi:translation initiation factor 1
MMTVGMADQKPFHTPFDALRALREQMPAAPAPEPPAPAPAAPPAEPASTPRIARAVVRLERAGRGGKEVTVVDHLELKAGERDAWLKALKSALGCGGVVEDDRLVLQGDQRERLRQLLRDRGVKKVTVS